VPYDVEKTRIVPGGKENMLKHMGKEHTLFTEALLEKNPLLTPFHDAGMFKEKASNTSILDTMFDWENMIKKLNLQLVQGMISFGFAQIATSVAQGYSSDTKLSKRVKDDLSKYFKEETEEFLETMLFQLFPVDSISRKWISDNANDVRSKLKPTCVIKKDSKEGHAQLQAKIIEEKMKAAGDVEVTDQADEQPPRRNQPRKTNLETKPSPPGAPEKEKKGGRGIKKAKALEFGKDTDKDMHCRTRRSSRPTSRSSSPRPPRALRRPWS